MLHSLRLAPQCPAFHLIASLWWYATPHVVEYSVACYLTITKLTLKTKTISNSNVWSAQTPKTKMKMVIFASFP